jgi:hypothetical protein
VSKSKVYWAVRLRDGRWVLGSVTSGQATSNKLERSVYHSRRNALAEASTWPNVEEPHLVKVTCKPRRKPVSRESIEGVSDFAPQSTSRRVRLDEGGGQVLDSWVNTKLAIYDGKRVRCTFEVLEGQ